MEQQRNRRSPRGGQASGSGGRPSRSLVAAIRRLRRSASPKRDDRQLSDAYRDVLRGYLALASSGAEPAPPWRRLACEALHFLGGQADRHRASLADYDNHRYGPFLGVSDEGGAARAIRGAALASPKALTLGRRASPLAIGSALDAERLGSVGEVPVGPDELAQIWTECAGRVLITTNVGSRVNLRFFRRAPVVTIPAGAGAGALSAAKAALAAAFAPFLDAPGGPRPLVAFVEFGSGCEFAEREQRRLLRALQRYLRSGGIAAPRIHQLGLAVSIGLGAAGRDAVVNAIDLASGLGIRHVAIDGVVRREADSVVSMPGLLNYLAPELVAQILEYARTKKVHVRPVNAVDPDTVAREIWTALNTARSMGLDLGKYGLFPLSLEECDAVVGQVQRWFPDWCAAPVFYVDQGIVSNRQVYYGGETAKGVAAWLRMVAKHKVKVVLIDTVDKSQGWKILKGDGDDSKGLLRPAQIAAVNALGRRLGIKVLWAGGITLEQAYEFGRLGVFGIYVTTSASKKVAVSGDYRRDPALAAEKQPTFCGVLTVKTLLEAGFLAASLASGSPRSRAARDDLRAQIEQAGLDPIALSGILPAAWRAWWRANEPKG